MITPKGIQPDPEKISAILERQPPKDTKQLLSFIQTCSWFRRFIPSFAEISRPLTLLTRKNAKWKWNEQQSAFDHLKTLLTTSPILRQADSRLPYVLKTDASSYAIGAVLLQGEREDERPVEYASRLLTSAEKNYHTTEREVLAVVWAVDKFRGYLENSEFVIQTDHQPLKWLMSLKSPSGRLARWSLALQSYNMRIDYTPGKSNVIADTLSRPPIPIEKLEVNQVVVEMPRERQDTIRQQQLEDPDVLKITQCFESPDPESTEFKKCTDRGFIMNDGILYRYALEDDDPQQFQQVVPKSDILRILEEYHNSPLAGHYGVDKTLHRIRSRYYWPCMTKTITDHVSKCIKCQRYKVKNLKPAGLLQTPTLCKRFEVIAIDLFGPLPETPTGEKWIFIIEDTASCWVELFALVQATSIACARILIDEILLRFGTPRRVTSDNGVQFVSETMQYVAHCLGFHQHLIPIYHAEANPVERKNRDLKTQLAILVGEQHTDWSEKLPSIRFAMNTMKCDSTGFTPAYLTFGRELRTPDDVQRDMRATTENENFIPQVTPYLLKIAETLRETRDKHEITQDKNKIYADRNRRPQTYQEGDKVLVDTHPISKAKANYTDKFAPRRDGPYKIAKIVTPTTYEVASLTDPEEKKPLQSKHKEDVEDHLKPPKEANPQVPPVCLTKTKMYPTMNPTFLFLIIYR